MSAKKGFCRKQKEKQDVLNNKRHNERKFEDTVKT